MYSKETLLNNSVLVKIRACLGNTNPVKGVLTKEEVKFNDNLMVICNVDSEDFFFTDDYCLGTGYLPESWVPSWCGLPLVVTPRECVPEGRVETVDQYIAVFHPKGRLIETIDELIDVLNKDIEKP